MNYRIKNGGRDWELRESSKRIWKYWFRELHFPSTDEQPSLACGLFKGLVQIWVLTNDLWGGAARLGNLDALFDPESHRYMHHPVDPLGSGGNIPPMSRSRPSSGSQWVFEMLLFLWKFASSQIGDMCINIHLCWTTKWGQRDRMTSSRQNGSSNLV